MRRRPGDRADRADGADGWTSPPVPRPRRQADLIIAGTDSEDDIVAARAVRRCAHRTHRHPSPAAHRAG
ncbi:hypothetical protein [Glaciibacter sp. 2TAF33]|uniref:hypothetical protein n=1 Tax=Glaciibacter sp. 2TAF33 TaxID=3233015 RepID=UPI003F8E0337